MYKDKNIIINILLFIWQLPQVILGLIMLAIFHNKKTYTNPNNHITVWNINCNHAFGNACFSTGPFIITCADDVAEDTLLHETGHSLQSIYLGWFFHIIISIPSICLYWIRRWKDKDAQWYHSHYPENWADKCGGVTTYCKIDDK